MPSQALRYLIVGGLTTGFYLALVATGLAVNLHYLASIAVAQVTTILVAFFAYRRWVFGASDSAMRDFARFLGVWSGGMIAGFALTPALVEILDWHPFVAQIIAIVVVTATNFIVHRYWTFGGKKPRPTDEGENA